MDESNLLVFGGSKGGYNCFDDSYKFDVEKEEFIPTDYSKHYAPLPESAHFTNNQTVLDPESNVIYTVSAEQYIFQFDIDDE